MFYICLENNKIVSHLNYKPNAPEDIKVIEITDEENDLLEKQTHYFDINTKKIIKYTNKELNQFKIIDELKENNIKNQSFLNSTDWKIMRHIREQALGLETSLTNKEYLELENKRQEAAKSINI